MALLPDDKIDAKHIDDRDRDSPSGSGVGVRTATRTLEAPEWIRDLSPEERIDIEGKLKRKIDLRLLPMVILMYIMNYLDRNNIAAARLAGMEKDLKLKGDEYQSHGNTSLTRINNYVQTSVSILFVGYLLMQIPSNLFLNKIGKPALYLPGAMIIWGIISALTAATQGFGGLIACRFFLGFVEAAYFPGCLYYLSCWYTRKELGLRTALLYSGSLISGAFSGLIAAGITANLNGAKGLLAWRWLFIIEGVITVFIAFAAFFVLPNFPRTTSWLTDRERELAVWRLEEDIGLDDWVDSHQQSFKHGLKLAFTDIKTYVLMVLLFGIVAAGSVTNFFPTVVATLKYNNIQSLLLTAPPYVLAVITAFANAWHADKTGERFLHIAIPLTVATAAFILAAATTATAPRYVAMMLMVPGVYTAFVVALAWISNTLPRPPAKRATALAFINAVSNSVRRTNPLPLLHSLTYNKLKHAANNFFSRAQSTRRTCTPKAQPPKGPRYIVAMSVNCAMTFIAICAALTLRTMLVRLNKKLDRGEPVDGVVNEGTTEAGRKGFRYKI
ncbi:pantothenate transporter liz1 protein [Rutstroemia sp. NJR-2017a BBW]|nr:pantothenate transporter liz1 protein [Rutstroemia sp. NJR-2017a BBW]